MQKILKVFALCSTLLCISVLSEEITLQQGANYGGCIDAYMYIYPGVGGENTNRLCVLNEC